MGIFDDLSLSLHPHRVALEGKLDAIIMELRRSTDEHTVGRPNMYDRWSTRPFGPAKGINPIEITRSPLKEAFLLESIWIRALFNKENEPNPSFMLFVNGLPTWAIELPSKPAKGISGFYSATIGGDVIVPRGSVLSIAPALPELQPEVVVEGAVTFRRELLDAPHPDAGAGVSNERFDRPSSTMGQYEPMRYLPDDPDSPWHGPDVPGAGRFPEDEFGGNISEDGIIAGEPLHTAPET